MKGTCKTSLVCIESQTIQLFNATYLRGERSILKGMQSLIKRSGAAANVDHHSNSAVPREEALKEACKLAISVWDHLLALPTRTNKSLTSEDYLIHHQAINSGQYCITVSVEQH